MLFTPGLSETLSARVLGTSGPRDKNKRDTLLGACRAC
ncbi:MAG: hypothetical protein ACJA0P_003959, partial [Planctomycetota bacterium]